MKLLASLSIILLAGCAVPRERPMEYIVLDEFGPRNRTTINMEILIDGPKTELQVLELLDYIIEVEVPRGALWVWVFETQERYDDYQRCGVAWDNWPTTKKGTPTECLEGEAKENYFVAGIVRNPTSGIEDIFYQGK